MRLLAPLLIFFSLYAKDPDFLVLGAQKGGTTSLYNYLNEHPDVKMPEKKELHFFDLHFEEGIEQYTAFFPKNKRFITGDVTPEYLVHPLAPERSFTLFPNTKLIVLLRNPVSRAFSRYKNHFLSQKTTKTFEECIEECLQTVDSDDFQFEHYLAYGLYAKQLKNWLKFYPKEQLLIIISEDFFENTQECMNRIYTFLNLKPFKNEKLWARFKGSNELKLNPETKTFLEEFYRPYNEDLQRLFDELGVGITLQWNKP